VTSNELFYKVMVGAFVLLMFLGAGMTVVIVSGVNETITLRLIGAFTGFLTATIGFASGYLLGKRNGNGHSGN